MRLRSSLLPLALVAATATGQTVSDSIRVHFPIVTTIGMRFAEPWMQVPLSLSYLPMKAIPAGKRYGLDEILAGIPGVFAQSRYGNQDVRLTIRGYGARGAGERSNAGTTRGIRVLNNGFPETEPDGRTSFDLVDLAGLGGVEVIRSNASSLYGNASGGVINLMANTSFDLPYSEISGGFGSYGFHREGITAGTILGNGRLYFSLSNTTAEGWRWHSRSAQALLSTGIVARIGERTDLGVHLTATSNIFRIPGPLSAAQYQTDPRQADSLYIKRDERRNNRLGRIGVSVTHVLDESNSISASAFVQPKFLQRSERGTFRDFTRMHVGGNVVYRHAASFGESVRNVLLAGMDEAYQDGAILFYNLTPASYRGTLRDNKREGANTFGAFLQDEISIGESWGALLGCRWDQVTYYSESFINLQLNETKAFTHLTPKIGLTWRLSPTHSIYANLGGGIEVPAGNETDPAPTFGADTIHAINPLLNPIRSTTLECGTKHVVMIGEGNSRVDLTYDVAAYWLRVTDDIIPYRNGRFYFTAGTTERMGVEVSAQAEWGAGVTANVAVTASRNRYVEYSVDSVHYAPALAGRKADFGGNHVVGIPDLYFTVGVKVEPPSFGGAFVSVNLQNVGGYFVNDANTIDVPAYTVINATVGVEHLAIGGGGLYLGGFIGVNNAGNATYIGSAWLNPDIVNGAPVYIEPGLPRNFIGSIRAGLNL